MHDDVVGGVQPLALILVGDYGDGPGRLVPDDATAAVLARELPALVVERVAVAVPRRVAEDRDVAVLFNPAHLDVVGDVAPDQVTADSVPRRTFGPQRAGMEPLDGRVAHHVPAEAVVQGDDVGVGILQRLLPRPVARCRDRRHRLLRDRRLRRRWLADGAGERCAAERRCKKRPAVPLHG